MSILAIENVTRQFSATAAPAVQVDTLTLQQGEILALLGPSGCGKTTLLRLIGGFERSQSGTVTLAGRIVSGAGQWVPPERRDVGMVFQDYALFPHLTVADNVGFGLRHLAKGKGMALLQDQVKEAIALVGLQGLDRRYPHELSGGQQQRVALARALAPRPTLILLDEPLSNLDVQVRLRLRQEVRDILKSTSTSAIFVTHDQEEALAIADRVAVMSKGQIEQIGTAEEIYQHPTSRFVAEFVTQANFIPAQQEGAVWRTELGIFEISEDSSTLLSKDELNGELMIRQEDLQLESNAHGEMIVCDRQFLGREYCYRLQLPSGKVLQARTPNTAQFTVGERVKCAIAPYALRFFPLS
jgi:iron(III) transport system ATP-binding protein